jgi:D-glycero-alpha-D-manno-heptose-7-phosphate kinase
MIVTKIPLRISLAGGGTDLPVYYKEREYGEVISFSINKYIYITSSKFHDPNVYNFKYSEIEEVHDYSLFKNPIVREVLKYFKIQPGYQYTSVSSVPGGTGLGSSSAFTTALIANIAERMNQPISQYEAASLAAHIELDCLGEPIGKQDHFGCAIGGIKRIRFSNQKVSITPIELSYEKECKLMKNLILVRVGLIRSASDILRSIQKSPDINFTKLDQIREQVNSMVEFVSEVDIPQIGRNLHKNWMIKKTLDNGVCDTEIDALYEKMVPKYAYGGKLLGAGGSGFFLFVLKDTNFIQELPSNISVSRVNIDKYGLNTFKL